MKGNDGIVVGFLDEGARSAPDGHRRRRNPRLPGQALAAPALHRRTTSQV